MIKIQKRQRYKELDVQLRLLNHFQVLVAIVNCPYSTKCVLYLKVRFYISRTSGCFNIITWYTFLTFSLNIIQFIYAIQRLNLVYLTMIENEYKRVQRIYK